MRLGLSSPNSSFVLVLGVGLQLPYLTGLCITGGLLLSQEKGASLGICVCVCRDDVELPKGRVELTKIKPVATQQVVSNAPVKEGQV